MTDTLRRHDLLRVNAEVWSRMLRSYPELSGVLDAAAAQTCQWPMIVRRRTKEDLADRIPAGFPLPPKSGKLRLTAQLAAEEITDRVQPVTLRSAREKAPCSWTRTIDALLEMAQRIHVEPLVFGSFLWEHVTGLSYCNETSDLDLLWRVSDPATATRLVNDLAVIDEKSPVRIDGEIILPDGGCVQWSELRQGASKVLVKTSRDVQLWPTPSLFQPIEWAVLESVPLL